MLPLFPLLLIAYFYVGRKLYLAIVSIFGISEALLFPYLGGALFVLTIYPLLVIVVTTIDLRKIERIFAGHYKMFDLLAWPFWFGVILIAEMLPWLLIADFLRLPFNPLYQQFKETWLFYQHRVALTLMVAYTLYIGLRIIYDTFRIRVIKSNGRFKNIPKKLTGLKIVHISDTQLDKRSRVRRLKRYIKKVNKLKPDVVFFTGDLVASDGRLVQQAAAQIGKIKSRFGVYACLGDHDARIGKDKVMTSLLKHNTAIWQESNQFIRIGSHNLLVTFLSNYDKQPANLDSMNFLMGQQPRGVLDIAIAHQPSESMIELASERGYHLFLIGHTHGGQVILRIFGMVVTPARMETHYYNGMHTIHKMLVNINPGLGFKMAPIRFRAPAQISLIEIERE